MTARIVRTESPGYARDLGSLQRTESFPIETEATDVLFHDDPFEEILRLSVYELTFRSIHMALGLSIRRRGSFEYRKLCNEGASAGGYAVTMYHVILWAARAALSTLPPLFSETYASIQSVDLAE